MNEIGLRHPSVTKPKGALILSLSILSLSTPYHLLPYSSLNQSVEENNRDHLVGKFRNPENNSGKCTKATADGQCITTSSLSR